MLLKSCQGQLDVSPTHWLKVRDEVARYLQRDQSVNLMSEYNLKGFHSLLAHLNLVKEIELKTIDLESGLTAARRGLLRAILAEFGHAGTLPHKPHDLVRFAELMNDLPRGRLAFLHFDAVLDRHKEYGVDLFRELRNRVMVKRNLVLLVHSRVPYGSLIPRGHKMSEIEFIEVELRQMP